MGAKVWIVERWEGADSQVVGVFSSHEAAKQSYPTIDDEDGYFTATEWQVLDEKAGELSPPCP